MVINNAEDTPDRTPMESEGETGASSDVESAGKPQRLSIDQASLDALLGPDGAERGQGDALLPKEELEALIAERASPAFEPAGGPGAETSQFFDEESLSLLLGDDTILGAGAGSGASAGSDVESLLASREPKRPPSPQELANMSLDQAAVDALLAVAAADGDGGPADAVPGDAPDMLQPPGLETPLVDGDLDEPIIQAEETSLLNEEPQAAAPEPAPAAPEPAPAAPEPAPAAPDDAALSADMINALVSAAGAPEATQEEPAGPFHEPPQDREHVGAVVSRAIEEHRRLAEAAHSAEEVEEEVDQAWAFRPRRGLLKTAVTVAVGTVSALGIFTYLYVHPYRAADVSVLAGLERSELSEAVREAERLTAEAAYGAAMNELRGALTSLGRGADMDDRADAQYLLAKAAFAGLGANPDAGQIAAAADNVNAFLDVHPRDARAVDCLRWKAALLEMQNAPVSAAALYAELLERAEGHPELDRMLFEAAEASFKAGRGADGAACLERLLREHSGSPAARDAKLVLSDAYVRAGRVDDAAALLTSLAEAQRDTRQGAEAVARLAQLDVNRGRADDAIRILEQYIGVSTTVEGNDRVHLALARAYRAAGRTGEAKTALDDILNFFPESDVTPSVYVELSNVYQDLGQAGQAMVTVRQAAQRYPGDRLVLNRLCEMLEAREAFSDAGPMRLAAYEAGKPDAELLLAAARDFRAGGDHAKAVEQYRRLLDAFPRAPQALEGSIELCEALYDQGRVTEASERLENLALATPGGPRQLPVLIALGKMFSEMGLNERAGEVYKQVAAQSVEPSVLAQAAVNLMSSGALDEGLAVARRVDTGKLGAQAGSALLTEVGEALLMKSPKESAEVLEKAYVEHPEHRTAELESVLIRAWLATGNFEGAEGVVSALESAAAGNAETYARRLVEAAMLCGDAAFERGDYARAAAMYGKVAQRPEGPRQAAWAKYQQATALMRLANYDESAALFDEVAASGGAFADDAKVKAAAARVEQRLGSGAAPSVQAAEEKGGGVGAAAESG